MNICLLNDSFPPVIDGVANVVINYAKYLQSEHSCGVLVGTPDYPGTDYSVYPYKVIPYQSFNTTALASGYRTGNPFVGKAISEMAAFAPDIIHSHCPASAMVIARILREQTDAPVILTYHTKYDIDIRRNVKLKPVADEGIRAMVSNIEACDEVWAVSRGAGESLKALGFQGDYRVMNNGVDFAKGRVDETQVKEVTGEFDLPAEVPVFLFVGRLMTYKGLPLILEALKMLAERGKDFRMVFVGKGPDRALLEKKAEELGISGKCIFVGPVYDREKLRAWNTRADLFLFPSTFDTNGLVVREAAACGLASVLIRGSCAAEGITDGRNGFLIDETAEAMAALLEKVGDDLPLLREVGQHAMDEIYCSWEDCISVAYDRYGAVLEEKRSGTLRKAKKQPTDLLVSMTAHTMEEQARLRRIGTELFNDFKETAVGMMENIQEAEESAEHFWDTLAEDIQRDLQEFYRK
ncbi:MAG: glycosyltransferase [Oscillospiraceae bacterium]|nr:glycosyltransferase [Oscillospiraceae bacterium]